MEKRSSHAVLVLVAAATLFVTLPADAATTLLSDTFNHYALGDWAPNSTHGNWIVRITGYGRVRIVQEGTRVLSLEPKEASTTAETHSSLVTNRHTFGDADLNMRVRTVRQYPRGTTPPTWDIAWTLWHWQDAHHYYYVILRPNGLGFGKTDSSGQHGLAYLPHGPQFQIGTWHALNIHQVSSTIDIAVDGQHLMTYRDRSSPYTRGYLGLCAENSVARFDSVTLKTA